MNDKTARALRKHAAVTNQNVKWIFKWWKALPRPQRSRAALAKYPKEAKR